MKYFNVLMIALFTVSTMFGQADAIDKYFTKYKDDNRFTMVHVTPKMFEMFAKVAPEDIDAEVREMISELKGLKILVSESNAASLYKEATTMINTSDYEELMTVRSEGENIKFLVKDSSNGDIVNELLLLVGGEEFVLMSFVGNINLKTISKLAKSVNIGGMEHLEKLKDRKKHNDH